MTKEITKKEAEQILIKKRQEKIDECSKKVQGILDEYNCTVEVAMVIELNKVTPIVKIISKD